MPFLLLAHHLKSIQFLLNLLCEHGSEPIARSNLPAAVVVRSRPGIVELYTRAKGNVLRTVWSVRKASGVIVAYTRGTAEIIFSIDLNVQRPGMIVIWCAWRAGLRSVKLVGDIAGFHERLRDLGASTSAWIYVSR